MKLVRTNGEIIECTAEEYLIISRGGVKDKEIEEFFSVIEQKVAPDHKNVEVPRRRRRNTKGVGRGNGVHVRWTKAEDKIILHNDLKTALKQLPYRNKQGIKARLRKFGKGGLRRPQNVQVNDYRRKMMKWVAGKAKELQITQNMSHTKSLKAAMELYKLDYASQNKRVE